MAPTSTLKSEIFVVHRYEYDAATLPRFAFLKSSLDFRGTIADRSSRIVAVGTVPESRNVPATGQAIWI